MDRPGYMQCSSCGGSARCPTCRGKGRGLVSPPAAGTVTAQGARFGDCADCHASGLCQACNGRGQVLRRSG